MSDKIPFIVFEGPDMCGKTSHIETVINKIKETTGKTFKAFKFPVYDGYKGEEILNHLKFFDISKYKHNKYEAIHILNVHAINLMVNKFAAIDKMIEIYNEGECDGFIVDRFDISQLVYDIAWCNSFKGLFKGVKFEVIRNFFYEAVERSMLTHNYYADKFDIKYVVFERSNVIKSAINFEKDPSRRYDKYDSNEYYQDCVSDLFEKFTLNKNKRNSFIEKICDMDQTEFTAINRLLIKIIQQVDPTFRCLTSSISDIQKASVLSDIFVNNTLCSVDTDAYYMKACVSSSSYTSPDGARLITPTNLGIDYDDEKLIKNIVSKCKNAVTSDIDKNIVYNIINYFGGK